MKVLIGEKCVAADDRARAAANEVARGSGWRALAQEGGLSLHFQSAMHVGAERSLSIDAGTLALLREDPAALDGILRVRGR